MKFKFDQKYNRNFEKVFNSTEKLSAIFILELNQ